MSVSWIGVFVTLLCCDELNWNSAPMTFFGNSDVPASGFICKCSWVCFFACEVYILFTFKTHLMDWHLLDAFCMSNLSVQLKSPIDHKIAVLCWRCVAAALAMVADDQQPLISWHSPFPVHPTSGNNYTCLALTRSGELDSHVTPDALFYYYSLSAAHSGPGVKPTKRFFPFWIYMTLMPIWSSQIGKVNKKFRTEFTCYTILYYLHCHSWN